jgi:hypothetical protein
MQAVQSTEEHPEPIELRRVVYFGVCTNYEDNDMRPIILVALAGLAVGLFNANRAEAMTTPAPAGLGMAADEVAVTTPVHCRRFMHRHRFGHDWSRGCRIGVTVAPRSADIRRDRAFIREGVRTRTTIRSRTGSSGQTSGERATTGGTSGQSSTGGSSGAGSSGTSSSTGGSSGAGSSGTSSSRGGSSGAGSSGTSSSRGGSSGR